MAPPNLSNASSFERVPSQACCRNVDTSPHAPACSLSEALMCSTVLRTPSTLSRIRPNPCDYSSVVRRTCWATSRIVRADR
jgi:hypothetical protein